MNSLFTDLKTKTMIDKKQIITDFDRIIGNNQEVTDDTHMDLVDECADYTETLVNKLFIANVSQQRELLNALADDFNESTDTYVGQTRIEKVLKAFNCG